MMTKEMLLEDHYIDDYVDDHVDREIESCFSASSPNNFFDLQEQVLENKKSYKYVELWIKSRVKSY